MDLISRILYTMISDATPILLAVLGGLWAYKANVLNVGLEGMMLSGAFVSVLSLYQGVSLPIAYLLGILSSLVLGLIFSYMGISRKGNVIVIGLAINMFVPAIADFVLKSMSLPNLNLANFNPADMKWKIPLVQKIPLVESILSGHSPITYFAYVSIAIIFWLLYRTKFGIYVRVVGENEEAAVSLGLNTNYYKYLAVLIGAGFSALAGINLAVENMGIFTNNMTAGRGFIAIAAIYCGSGSPLASAIYAVLFGLARSLAINLSIYAGPEAALFDIIPYLVMVIVLAIVSIIKRKNIRTREF